MRYVLCYFTCNEYLVSDIWDVSLYNDQFPKYKLTNIFSYTGWKGRPFQTSIEVKFMINKTPEFIPFLEANAGGFSFCGI